MIKDELREYCAKIEKLFLQSVKLQKQFSYLTLPKSRTRIGLLSLEGKIDNKLDYNEILCAALESLEVPATEYLEVNGCILDFSLLEIGAEKDFRNQKIDLPKYKYILAVFPENSKNGFEIEINGLDGAVENVKEAFQKMKFHYRKERFDNGKNITESKNPDIEINLAPVSFEISKLNFECYQCYVQNSKNIGFIKVSGDYGIGSRGAMDALFLNWQLRRYSMIQGIDATVIDLRDFNYVWGDDISFYRYRNSKVIVNQSQVEAFSYFIDPVNFCFKVEDIFNKPF